MSKYSNREFRFLPVFFTVTAALSVFAAGLVYWLTRGMQVVIISQTKVTAKPVTDHLWPVLMLAVIAAVFCCSVAGLIFYTHIKKRIGKPYRKLKEDLQRMASGDLSRTIPFWNARDIYDMAVDAEKARESLKGKLILVTTRYNAVKNFLDQKNFEVDGSSSEILKQKLQSVDEQLKAFKLRVRPVPELDINVQLKSDVRPRPDTIVKDAEEMVKA